MGSLFIQGNFCLCVSQDTHFDFRLLYIKNYYKSNIRMLSKTDSRVPPFWKFSIFFSQVFFMYCSFQNYHFPWATCSSRSCTILSKAFSLQFSITFMILNNDAADILEFIATLIFRWGHSEVSKECHSQVSEYLTVPSWKRGCPYPAHGLKQHWKWLFFFWDQRLLLCPQLLAQFCSRMLRILCAAPTPACARFSLPQLIVHPGLINCLLSKTLYFKNFLLLCI